MPHIVLASSSPRRQELLASLGLQFTVLPSDADETVKPSTPPDEYVTILAERKARQTADQLTGKDAISKEHYQPVDATDVLVIGSDTIVVHQGVVLGKPKDADEAQSMLSKLQGATHTVYTGVCVHQPATGKTLVDFRSTEVTMRPLSKDEIARYVATGEPMDKAGSYAIQGLGATIVDRIDGDYFTVVGLSVSLVAQMLASFGVTII